MAGTHAKTGQTKPLQTPVKQRHRQNPLSIFRRSLFVGTLVAGTLFTGKALAQETPKEIPKPGTPIALAEAVKDTAQARRDREAEEIEDEWKEYNSPKTETYQLSLETKTLFYYSISTIPKTHPAWALAQEKQVLLSEIQAGKILTTPEIDQLVARGLIPPSYIQLSIQVLRQHETGYRQDLNLVPNNLQAATMLASAQIAIQIKLQNPSYQVPLSYK